MCDVNWGFLRGILNIFQSKVTMNMRWEKKTHNSSLEAHDGNSDHMQFKVSHHLIALTCQVIVYWNKVCVRGRDQSLGALIRTFRQHVSYSDWPTNENARFCCISLSAPVQLSPLPQLLGSVQVLSAVLNLKRCTSVPRLTCVKLFTDTHSSCMGTVKAYWTREKHFSWMITMLGSMFYWIC